MSGVNGGMPRPSGFRDVLLASLDELEDRVVAQHEHVVRDREQLLCRKITALQVENSRLGNQLQGLESKLQSISQQGNERKPQEPPKFPGDFMPPTQAAPNAAGDGFGAVCGATSHANWEDHNDLGGGPLGNQRGRAPEIDACDPFPEFVATVIPMTDKVPLQGNCVEKGGISNGINPVFATSSCCFAEASQPRALASPGLDPQQPGAASQPLELTAAQAPPEPVARGTYETGHSVMLPRGTKAWGSRSQSSLSQGDPDVLVTHTLAAPDAQSDSNKGLTEAQRTFKHLRELSSSVADHSVYEHRNGGMCQGFDETLDTVMGIIIFVNIAQIGLSSEYRRDWPGWLGVNIIFAMSYLGEMMVKMALYGAKAHFCGKSWGWAVFDILMAFQVMLEVYLTLSHANRFRLSLFRIVRLCRLTRIIRLVRLPLFRDLVMMIDGIIGGSRTLAWSLVLLLTPLYAVAICLRETLGEETDMQHGREFRTLGSSMFTMFRCILGDCNDEKGQPIFVHIVNEDGWHYGLFYVCLIAFTTFGLFNVIIAIYVENTVVAAKSNEALQRRARLSDQQRLAVLSMKLVASLLDSDDTGRPGIYTFEDDASISQETFTKKMSDPNVQKILDELDIAVEDRLDLYDILDADGTGELQVGELLQGVRKLRGEARRSDVIANGLVVRALQERFVLFEEAVRQRQILMAENVKQNGEISRMLQDKFDAFAEAVRERQVHMADNVRQNGASSAQLQQKFDSFEKSVKERQLQMAENVKKNGAESRSLQEKLDKLQSKLDAKIGI